MRRALVLPLLAVACTAAERPRDPADSPHERGAGTACNAAAAHRLVGRQRSEAAAAEAKRLTGAAAIRWIPLGAMVTMDYRPDRLNIRLDRNGRILSLDCG
jgi:hypothetical protein